MEAERLQAEIQRLQEKYTSLLTQAAQAGRTAEVQTLTDQMQVEMQALINVSTQAGLSGTTEAAPDADGDDLDDDEDEDEEEEDDDDDEEEEEDDEDEDDDEED